MGSYDTSVRLREILRSQAVPTNRQRASTSGISEPACLFPSSLNGLSVSRIPLFFLRSSMKNSLGMAPWFTTWKASMTLLKPSFAVILSSSSCVRFPAFSSRQLSRNLLLDEVACLGEWAHKAGRRSQSHTCESGVAMRLHETAAYSETAGAAKPPSVRLCVPAKRCCS